MIGNIAGQRVVFSANQFGRQRRNNSRPWPGPPADVTSIPPTSSGVLVQWVLKYDGGFGYTYGPYDGTTAVLYVARLFGFQMNAQGSAIGGVFYNASVRPMLVSKTP